MSRSPDTPKNDKALDKWGWNRASSEASFEEIGERFIEVMRRLRRQDTLASFQKKIYAVEGQQLTAVQVEALQILARKDAWRMTEIARELRIDHSTASRTFAPLVEMGLVDRKNDPDDGRTVLIHATSRGRKQTREIHKRMIGQLRAVMGHMAPERRVLLTQMLEEYMASLEMVTNQIEDL